jgi:hypothetical protein
MKPLKVLAIVGALSMVLFLFVLLSHLQPILTRPFETTTGHTLRSNN